MFYIRERRILIWTVNMYVYVILAAEKKEEPESDEEDEDLGFGLFD